jgi:hypothetical protein
VTDSQRRGGSIHYCAWGDGSKLTTLHPAAVGAKQLSRTVIGSSRGERCLTRANYWQMTRHYARDMKVDIAHPDLRRIVLFAAEQGRSRSRHACIGE